MGEPEQASRHPPRAHARGAEEVYEALVLGTRDIGERLTHVLLGLSEDHRSRARSRSTRSERRRSQAFHALPVRVRKRRGRGGARQNLGSDLTLPIAEERRFEALTPVFSTPEDVTEENLQSRIRGNADGALEQIRLALLTTGNKSEYSVGYATLYGDMAGGSRS